VVGGVDIPGTLGICRGVRGVRRVSGAVWWGSIAAISGSLVWIGVAGVGARLGRNLSSGTTGLCGRGLVLLLPGLRHAGDEALAADSAHDVGAAVPRVLAVVVVVVYAVVVGAPLLLAVGLVDVAHGLAVALLLAPGHDVGEHVVVLEHEAVELHVLVVLRQPALDRVHRRLRVLHFDVRRRQHQVPLCALRLHGDGLPRAADHLGELALPLVAHGLLDVLRSCLPAPIIRTSALRLSSLSFVRCASLSLDLSLDLSLSRA